MSDALNAVECPVAPAHQTRNIFIFAFNTAVVYFAAPVLYIGTIQAAQLDKMHTSSSIANLPGAFYFYATPLPIFFAWYFHKTRHFKPMVCTCYALVSLMGALVTLSLLIPTPAPVTDVLTRFSAVLPEDYHFPADWFIPALLLHAAVLGCVFGIRAMCDWELLGRCVAPSRRGEALALAFGVGPSLAFISSGGAQAVLSGKFEVGSWTLLNFTPLEFPHNFALLYGLTVPLMALSGVLASFLVVPLPAEEPPREPFHTILTGLFDFLSNRTALLAAIAMIGAGFGYMIIANFTLFTKQAIGVDADAVVGYQQMWRFGFKVVGGLTMGALLSRTSPRAGILFTSGFATMSVLWLLSPTQGWQAGKLWPILGPQVAFLLSFGLMGVGELFGAYFPNYLLNCSPKAKMRRNQAYVSLFNMPCGIAGMVYGGVADRLDLIASFQLAAAILLLTVLLIVTCLPRHPRPTAE